MNKTHFMGPAMKKTACGVKCWPEKESPTEASTVLGDRLEITTEQKRVTCLVCRRSRRFRFNDAAAP